MQPLTEERIRASLLNASQRQRRAMTLPPGWPDLPWPDLDLLGWRDPKIPQLGYVVVELEEGPVGVLLRQAERVPRQRAQCSWCEDVRLPAPVVFFSARRAGAAGRNGSTIGTLACAGFECSANVRRRPPLAYVGFDLDAARQRRIEALREHVAGFVRHVRDDD
jgi:hypothetical protein